jgi:hypothetical protein
MVYASCQGIKHEPTEIDYTSRSNVSPTGHVTDNTSSDDSLHRAAHWLQKCTETHKKCCADKPTPSWYPTRLLYLGDGGHDESFVWLIHTAREQPTGPYTTLSHCWGDKRPLQLTRQIASQPRPAILMTDMPKTFRDAVDVSRRLGVRYLWIDSMCIIQDKDDLQDWYREASLMDKVYLYSYCNISAADAEDSTKGLFRPRWPQNVGTWNVKVDLTGFGPHTGLVECTVTDERQWSRNIADSPLNQCGWVFQERLLSPRILHFCRNEIFWECREHAACESDPGGRHSYTARSSSSCRTRGTIRYSRQEAWTRLLFGFGTRSLLVPIQR